MASEETKLNNQQLNDNNSSSSEQEIAPSARPTPSPKDASPAVDTTADDEDEPRPHGDVDFGPEAQFVLQDRELAWFDHYLKGAQNGIDREPPVRIFYMGANIWRGARPSHAASATIF